MNYSIYNIYKCLIHFFGGLDIILGFGGLSHLTFSLVDLLLILCLDFED